MVLSILPKTNETHYPEHLLFSKYAQDSEFPSVFGRIEKTINCFRDLLTFSSSGQPRQGRQARFIPCLDFGFQYALIRNNRSKNFGVEYWPLPDSNSQWRPCSYIGGLLCPVTHISTLQLIIHL